MKHDLYSELSGHKKSLPPNFKFIWFLLQTFKRHKELPYMSCLPRERKNCGFGYRLDFFFKAFKIVMFSDEIINTT